MNTETKGYNLTIPVNNFQLSYDDVGESSTPIIFLHGYPFNKSMWKGQLEFLKTSYRLIACDIRGFGESTDEESTLSIDMFADDLIAFMDKLNIEKAIVCGLSMGGYIAMNAQKRFPVRFEALVLSDTQCIADSVELKARRYETIEEIADHGVFKFNEGIIIGVFHKDSIKNKKEVVSELINVVFSNTNHIICQGLSALAERTETCSTLNKITIPTLIICGREDKVTPLVQSEFMHAKIEGSILHIIDDAGHVSNLEQANEFNNLLLDFLISVSDIDIENLRKYQMSSKLY